VINLRERERKKRIGARTFTERVIYAEEGERAGPDCVRDETRS
jgi:hypothetical protein